MQQFFRFAAPIRIDCGWMFAGALSMAFLLLAIVWAIVGYVRRMIIR